VEIAIESVTVLSGSSRGFSDDVQPANSVRLIAASRTAALFRYRAIRSLLFLLFP
jgi:hypothetical protein